MLKLILIISMLIIASGTGVIFTPQIVDQITGKMFESYDIVPR